MQEFRAGKGLRICSGIFFVLLLTSEVDGSVLPAKSLGYWWEGDLLAKHAVEKDIEKAFFFHNGSMGVFQGDLSPLSTCSALETCVMPILMYNYGSEN